MNLFQNSLILAFAFLAVFAEAALDAPRHWLGAQIDLLPGLMVFTALNAGLPTIALLAIFGGLWFDSLSANPLGISILPLLAIGWPIYLRRELILRDLPFAQFVLGASASAAMPLVTILMLLSGSQEPLIGWGSVWQWIVMTAGGAAATPLIFSFMNWCNHALGYQVRKETTFRLDREIKRTRR
jgi:hypothetical protein